MSDHDAGENNGLKASRPVVGQLEEKDLPEAARIVRLAFGAFLGAPNPDMFWADRDYVYGRQHAAHVASFGAKAGWKINRLQLCHQLGKRRLLRSVGRPS